MARSKTFLGGGSYGVGIFCLDEVKSCFYSQNREFVLRNPTLQFEGRSLQFAGRFSLGLDSGFFGGKCICFLTKLEILRGR